MLGRKPWRPNSPPTQHPCEGLDCVEGQRQHRTQCQQRRTEGHPSQRRPLRHRRPPTPRSRHQRKDAHRHRLRMSTTNEVGTGIATIEQPPLLGPCCSQDQRGKGVRAIGPAGPGVGAGRKSPTPPSTDSSATRSSGCWQNVRPNNAKTLLRRNTEKFLTSTFLVLRQAAKRPLTARRVAVIAQAADPNFGW